MKAARFHAHGGADVLKYEDAPDPVVPAGWALVRVRACALNHLDLFQRRGLEHVRIPLPHISGADVAGEVVHVDASQGEEEWRAGDRVMLQPGLSCGHCAACLAGHDNRCPDYDVLGYQSAGGYAELIAAPVANLIRLPAAIPFPVAAAFPLAFLTAWHMLFNRAGLREGETVLVVAASSGVGQAAVQLARHAGARVIATAGGDAKLARAKALGADTVVDHHSGDVVAEVRRATDRRGVDVVFEHVGVATWDRSVRCLARGGRLVTCGATTGHAASLDLRHLFARQLSFLGSYMGEKQDLLRAAPLFFAGQITPVVDREFSLSEAAQAHRYLEESQQFGKVVLVV
jgi:NADPH:quinone reductase-like Zn-dependent oxidoreductase